MTAIVAQLRLALRLYFRNRMAMLYGYLFPTVFLVAFYVLYRYERVPLVRHMGELLTVTILGGACFGLATTLVSERERGVWLRYRLTPVPAGSLVVSTLAARYVLLLSAGLLQLLLAMALGMPLPEHVFGLVVAFSVASFAFLGLGLVIAMLADNVPAVQALGQSIFLPMLIIGGVAVPLTSLPDWALHISAYFPGRYAVEAIQATIDGDGLDAAAFSLLALVLIGLAACVAGAGMFRWDAGQRFMTSQGRGWLTLAFAGWVGVGLLAQAQGRVIPPELMAERAANAGASAGLLPSAPGPDAATPPQAPATSLDDLADEPAAAPSSDPTDTPADHPSGDEAETSSDAAGASVPDAPAANEPSPAEPPPGDAPAATEAEPPAVPDPDPDDEDATEPPAEAAAEPKPASDAPAAPAPAAWQQVTVDQVMADLVFDRLPPDAGVVTPVAALDDVPPEDLWLELDDIQAGLETWAPGRVPDVLERVRNLLFVPAVVDVYQLPIEPYVPLMVFDILRRDIDAEVLIKALYHVAVYPDEGSDAAVDQLSTLGLGSGPADMREVRGRTGVYAVKLIGRITGARPGR